MKTTILRHALLSTGLALALGAVAGASEGGGVDGSTALARLQEGNRRFVNADVSPAKPLARQRAATAQTQRPFAIVVACADSRVAPEIVFDQGLGELFVIRTAGNLVDDYALGSIEYAVDHLGARLVLVLGHERCGAVAAALSGGEAPGHVRALVDAIAPAVKRSHVAGGGDPLDAAVVENARAVAKKIRESRPALSDLAHAEVKIVAARYDLDSGVVTLIE
jgi:carbonic anhydrase